MGKFIDKLSLNTKLCIVLAVVSCLVYANTLSNDYALDDVMMITGNHYVKQGFAGIPILLKTHHLEGFGANTVFDYYRPLSLVVFAIEYQFFGEKPFAAHLFHLFNILFFASCVVLLFLFLNKLFKGEQVIMAFIAALLFAVHSVHTEVVANIKSCDELLCFFFAFLSLNIFIDYSRQGRFYQLITGTFFFFIAILSKETAVTFLGVIPLVFFFYENENKKRSILITICAGLVVALFLVLWAYAQSRSEIQQPLTSILFKNPGSNSNEESLSFASKILILGYQLKLLFVPYPLNSNYSLSSLALVKFSDIEVLLSFIVYLFICVAGVFRIIKKNKDLVAFGILFYLVTLSLYANFVFPLGQPLANRYAFFPSVGFCILFAIAFNKWVVNTKTDVIAGLLSARSLIVLIPVLCFYSILTVARNKDWKDNYTLVMADLPKSGNNYIMEYKAGLEILNKSDAAPDSIEKARIINESIKHFSLSLLINPEYTESHSDIGVAYFRLNHYDSAEVHYKAVLRLNPLHLNACTNLGTMYFKLQRFGDAIVYYRKAVLLDSAVDIAWYNMGICYGRIQQLDSAILCMKKVVQIAPAYDEHKSFGNLAILYEMTGNADSARKYEQLTKQYFPDFVLRSSLK